MRRLWKRLFQYLFPDRARTAPEIESINEVRKELAGLSDEELKAAGRRASSLVEIVAVTAVVAARVLGLEMFDVQLRGALALANGRIAEMQTGEGKTLAAVPAVIWYAREGRGVHVMTVNDYLARRDSHWMGGIYESWASRSAASSRACPIRSAAKPTPATSPTPRPTK